MDKIVILISILYIALFSEVLFGSEEENHQLSTEEVILLKEEQAFKLSNEDIEFLLEEEAILLTAEEVVLGSRMPQSLEGKQNVDLPREELSSDWSYKIRQENYWSGEDAKTPLKTSTHNISLALDYKLNELSSLSYYHPVIVAVQGDEASQYVDDPYLAIQRKSLGLENFSLQFRHYLPVNIAQRENGYRGHSRLYLHYEIPNDSLFLRMSLQYRKYWADHNSPNGDLNEHVRLLPYLTVAYDLSSKVSIAQIVGLYDMWLKDGTKRDTEIYLYSEVAVKLNQNWVLELAAESSVSRKEDKVIYPATSASYYYINFVFSP